MNGETGQSASEAELSSVEQKGILRSIAHIGSYLLNKVQIFIESQEGEIGELNRQSSHENNPNADFTRISK